MPLRGHRYRRPLSHPGKFFRTRRRARIFTLRLDRSLDWDLLELFGYQGSRSVRDRVEGDPPAFAQTGSTPRIRDFFVWAVEAGPMVWRHVFAACQATGYRLDLDRPRVSFWPGPMESLCTPEPLLYYALGKIPQGEPELPGRSYPWDIPVCRAARFHAHFQVLTHLLENGADPSRVIGSGSLGYFDLHRVPVAVFALFENHGVFWKNITHLPECAFLSVWYSGCSWTKGQRARGNLMMRKLEWFLERGLGLNDQL